MAVVASGTCYRGCRIETDPVVFNYQLYRITADVKDDAEVLRLCMFDGVI
jgi:hypothetical protein